MNYEEIKKPLLLDASVLIDYCNTDLSVLSLAVKNINQLIVCEQILGEVNELTTNDCIDLGIKRFEPTIEQLILAPNNKALSLADNLCFIMARDSDLICVTNDKRLRSECKENGVDTMWGLEILLILNRKGKMTALSAIDIANNIAQVNPHVTPKILSIFAQKIGN